MLSTIAYNEDKLTVLDQTLLPNEVVYETLDTVEQVFEAIATLKVRGAPLIGVAAAYGVLVGIRAYRNNEMIRDELQKVCSYLGTARPTAVNLKWALDRMLNVAASVEDTSLLFEALTQEAQRIHDEDVAICRGIGEHTYELIKGFISNNSVSILTHCNAGALATSGTGTATSIMYLLKDKGVDLRVYATETRPLLQGARLTAFELSASGINTTLIADSTVATILSKGMVDFVIVGADRVAANLDVANKVGTLGVSIIARQYGVPFYVACPSPTFDKDTACGKDIVIEERSGRELTTLGGIQIAPEGIQTYNPAFDVTPHENITAVITENGVLG